MEYPDRGLESKQRIKVKNYFLTFIKAKLLTKLS